MKKIFIISLILILIVLISWGTYTIIIKTKLPDKNQSHSDISDADNKKSDTTELNSASTNLRPSLFNISDIDVLSADMDISANLIRYVTKNGTVMTMTPRGTNQKQLFKLNIPNLQKVIWSPDNNDLIIYAIDGLYTYSSKIGTTHKLNSSIDYANWSNINNKILYKYFDNETDSRSINISKQNGENWKEIINVPFRHTSFMQVPNSSNMAYWQVGDSFIQSKLQTVNIISPNKPTLIHEGLYGADYLYSPNGKYILVSSSKSKGNSNISLGIMNNNGGEYKNLLAPTLIQKSVWSKDSKTIYYAHPTNIPENSIMPNDYINNKFKTKDTFWKVDINGEKTRLIDLENLTENIDAKNLFISENEDSLFFINSINNLLYRLKLTK